MADDVQSLMDIMTGKALRVSAGLGAAVASATKAVTGYDAAAGRFRNSAGQFQRASSVASGMFQGSMGKIAGAATSVTPAIANLGANIVALATGALPSAVELGSKLGATLGGAMNAGASQAAAALAKLGPEGAAAGAALEALTGAAAATVGTLLTLAGLAVEVTEKITMLRLGFAGLAGSAAGGQAVQDTIANLNLPFATSQVNSWAASLLAAGVKGKNLEAELRAVAAAEASGAIFGKAWGSGAENFFRKMGEGGTEADELLKKIQKGGMRGSEVLKGMGLDVGVLGGQAAVAKMNAAQLTDAVTKALQVKGAGPLEAMGNALPTILTKAQEGIRSLFDGLGPAIDPFMKTIKSLFGEFNKGGVGITILKPIVTEVFGTLFRWATVAVNTVHKGFLMLAIGALTAYIALRPYIDSFKQFVTSATFLQGMKVMLIGLAVVAGLLAIPFVLAAAAVLIFGAELGGIALAATYVMGFVTQAASAIADWVSTAATAASDWVGGLVAGIGAGAAAFVTAVSGLAQQGLAAFTGIFKIASHSKVMKEHGEENIAGAAAAGVDQGGAKMDASMARLGGGAPGGGSAASARGGAKGDDGGVHIHGDVNVTISGAEGPASAWQEFVANLQALKGEAPEPVGP